jgi:hypothetical protein
VIREWKPSSIRQALNSHSRAEAHFQVHSPRVSHKKIKVDIFGKVIGHDAVEFPFQNHVFRSAVNEFHVAQLEIADLFSGNVQIFLMEERAARFRRSEYRSRLLENSVGCFRNFPEKIACLHL